MVDKESGVGCAEGKLGTGWDVSVLRLLWWSGFARDTQKAEYESLSGPSKLSCDGSK